MSAASRDVARALLERELNDIGRASAADLATAGERLIARVADGLSRSFGAFGASAVLSRALKRAQETNPVLVTVALRTDAMDSPLKPAPAACVVGLSSTADAYGAAAALEGLTAWLAHLAHLLGALIGENLATIMLEQSAAAPGDRRLWTEETMASEPTRPHAGPPNGPT